MTLIIIDVMTVYLYRVYLRLFLIIQVELGENFESIVFTVHCKFKILWVVSLLFIQQRKENLLKTVVFLPFRWLSARENVIKTIISQWLLNNVWKGKNTHFHWEGRWRDSKSGEGGRGRLGTLEISTYVLLDLMEVGVPCIWWYIWQTTGSNEVTAVVLLLPSSPCVRWVLSWDVNSNNLLLGKGTGVPRSVCVNYLLQEIHEIHISVNWNNPL